MRPHPVRTAADLGRALRSAREQAGMTQQELAERLGVERSYVAHLEGGRTNPLLDLAFGAVQTLGCELALARDPRRG